MVSSLGAPLVPLIAARYDVPISTAQWALTATLVTGAVVTPVLGRLGTGRLRRPVVLGGLLVVLAGTLLSALPLGFGALLAGRVLQGVGLGLLPLALAVARDAWRGERLTSSLALLSVTTVAGAGLGYPVTAFVAEHAGVPGAYAFGGALVAVTLLMVWLEAPVTVQHRAQQVDLVGAVLLGAGISGVLLAVSQGDRWGWTSLATLLLAGGGLALLAGWVGWSRRRTRRGHQPLVDLRLATRPGVDGPNLAAVCLGAGMYSLLTVSVLVVQADGSAGYGLGMGVATAGLVLLPYSLMSVCGSPLARRASRRFGPEAVLPIGALVFASSQVLLAWHHDELWQVLLAMLVGGLGSGFSFASMPLLIVPHVPAAETGSAMAFNQVLRYLGFAVGSAVSVALIEVYGADDAALRGSLLTAAALCALAGLGAWVLARRARRLAATAARPTAPA